MISAEELKPLPSVQHISVPSGESDAWNSLTPASPRTVPVAPPPSASCLPTFSAFAAAGSPTLK